MEQKLQEIKAQGQLAIINIDATFSDYAQQLQDQFNGYAHQSQVTWNTKETQPIFLLTG
jgi:hypothetical protein